MFGIKKFILGVLVGLVVGLWAGVNIGKDKPIWSNPFAEETLQEKLIRSTGETLEKGGKAIRDSLDK